MMKYQKIDFKIYTYININKIYSYLKVSLQQEGGEEEKKNEFLSFSLFISLSFSLSSLSLSLFGERKFIQAFFQDWNRCCSK